MPSMVRDGADGKRDRRSHSPKLPQIAATSSSNRQSEDLSSMPLLSLTAMPGMADEGDTLARAGEPSPERAALDGEDDADAAVGSVVVSAPS
ncbi:hypothetical protein DWU99_00350 [Dyella psychrodurans]|uniref:Uncharacterized protein n=1 Tax=Dyella psychrodurans TaxID=1927960 RepID=A0A370XBT7_9GAMM|nr:hypothetical protein DWU99_00350 [Dyella psychrodurans]